MPHLGVKEGDVVRLVMAGDNSALVMRCNSDFSHKMVLADETMYEDHDLSRPLAK